MLNTTARLRDKCNKKHQTFWPQCPLCCVDIHSTLYFFIYLSDFDLILLFFVATAAFAHKINKGRTRLKIVGGGEKYFRRKINEKSFIFIVAIFWTDVIKCLSELTSYVGKDSSARTGVSNCDLCKGRILKRKKLAFHIRREKCLRVIGYTITNIPHLTLPPLTWITDNRISCLL